MKSRNKYKIYKFLTRCPICSSYYDKHWKVVSHIRKTKDLKHWYFLKNQEEEVVEKFLNNCGKVDNLFDELYKNLNIFSGISYMRIVEILDKYLGRDKVRFIQKERISRTMKNVPKSLEHNKKVSIAVKKAWKEGKFDTIENIKARKRGYEKRKTIVGKNNPMYGRPSPKGSGRGKGGIRKDIGHYVRSSWEANLCRIFNFVKRTYIYESERFSINVNGIEYTYCPDFYIPDRKCYYEVKGHAKSSKKWICWCDTCKINRLKIEEVKKKYGVKIILIGRKEYNRLKGIFKKKIENWE